MLSDESNSTTISAPRPIRSTSHSGDLLPNLQGSYRFSPNFVVRAAATKALGRPQLDQIIPNITVTEPTGNGTGSVTSPAGLNCVITAGITSGNCSVNVTDGTSVTLTASATSPNSFRAWSGDCASSTGNTCTLTMNTNRAPGARFDTPVPLTATPGGTGNGSILASGVIACTRTNNANTGTCSSNVNFGTVVTLTASAGSFSTFVGWTGACTGSASTCQVTMDQARSVGATFTRLTGVVTFSLTGSGTGGVVTGRLGVRAECGTHSQGQKFQWE